MFDIAKSIKYYCSLSYKNHYLAKRSFNFFVQSHTDIYRLQVKIEIKLVCTKLPNTFSTWIASDRKVDKTIWSIEQKHII